MTEEERLNKAEEFLKYVFRKDLKLYELEPNDDIKLRYDLNLDSLNVMEACMEAENKLKIKVPNIEIVRCVTWGDLKAVIANLL